ncbi:MAG: acyl-CoA dehydrogenase, partial [Myxococcota bacterium]
CTLSFDRVSLGREQIVGEPGGALVVLAPALVHERVVTAALACGLGQYALDKAAAYQATRLLRSAPVNAESALNAVGEIVLGLPRSY